MKYLAFDFPSAEHDEIVGNSGFIMVVEEWSKKTKGGNHSLVKTIRKV